MNILVIPAYEPDQELVKLVKKIQEKEKLTIVIVDDGSGPAYAPIFDQCRPYAQILQHDKNKGKGRALKTALQYIKEAGYQGHIITADSDGQHTVWDILRMARRAGKEPDKLILGVRSFTGKVPLRSRIGNDLTALIFKLQTGIFLRDTQTGLRAFSTDRIDDMLAISGETYEYEMNVLLEARHHMDFAQEPIETIYINHNAASHFHPIRDSFKIYSQLLKFTASSLSSFIIDYLVYGISLFALAFLSPSLRIIFANALARITSSIFNYSSNKYLVFKNKDSIKRTGSSYFALVFALFILDTSLIYFLNSLLGINLLLAKVLVGFLLFLLSWYLQKKWIFKERTPALV